MSLADEFDQIAKDRAAEVQARVEVEVAISEALDHLLNWLDQRYLLTYQHDLNMRRRNAQWEQDKMEFRELFAGVILATRP